MYNAYASWAYMKALEVTLAGCMLAKLVEMALPPISQKQPVHTEMTLELISVSMTYPETNS